MKKNYTILSMLALLFFIGFEARATKITVQTGNFQFTPQTVTANVGDTIRWEWQSGSHTTTCDGSSMTSKPGGAPPWNSPITAGNPSFEYVLTVPGTYNYKCSPHAAGGMVGTINAMPASAVPVLNGLENSLDINPPAFKSDAVIKFNLASNSKIQLSIYDFAGRKIETLINKSLSAGEHIAKWDASDVPQGTYFCRLECREFVLTRKFIRIK